MASEPDSPPTEETRLSDVGAIVQRLHMAPANPVTRARIRVEQEVPPERRGPGWERHWRELEAYVDSLAGWQPGAGQSED